MSVKEREEYARVVAEVARLKKELAEAKARLGDSALNCLNLRERLLMR